MPSSESEGFLTRSRGPAAYYRHDHPPVRNVNVEYEESLTFGQRVADRVTAVVGSWPFIIAQTLFLTVWIVFNVYLAVMARTHTGFLKAWDPYPFILLNLMLSFQAAYTGPIVMMSQNRQAEKDRLQAEHDYQINLKAEEEIQVIMKHLSHQDNFILESINEIKDLKDQIAGLERKIEEVMRRFDERDKC